MDYSKYGFRSDYDPNNRVVKYEKIEFDGETYRVSTVDLGIDHQWGEGPPLYFETMIFHDGSNRDMYCRRYSERNFAHKGHEAIVNGIKNGRYEIESGYFEVKDTESTESPKP